MIFYSPNKYTVYLHCKLEQILIDPLLPVEPNYNQFHLHVHCTSKYDTGVKISTVIQKKMYIDHVPPDDGKREMKWLINILIRA